MMRSVLFALLVGVLLGSTALSAAAADDPSDSPLVRGAYRDAAWVSCGSEGFPCAPTYTRPATCELREAPTSCWSGVVAGYMWATSITGSSYVNGQESDVDIAFEDLYDKLDYAFQGYAEVRYDRWTFAIDATTLALDNSAFVTGTPLTADTRIEQTLIDLRFGYTFLRKQVGSSQWGRCCYPRHLTLDGILGVRYWKQRQSLTLGVPGGPRLPLADDEDWWDPYVGGRLRWQFAKRWGATLYGDVGGFEIGDASNLTWQVQALVRFHITRRLFVGLGYRALGLDRVTGSGLQKNGIDVTEHGPLVGIGFLF